jgi:hypothetical protein
MALVEGTWQQVSHQGNTTNRPSSQEDLEVEGASATANYSQNTGRAVESHNKAFHKGFTVNRFSQGLYRIFLDPCVASPVAQVVILLRIRRMLQIERDIWSKKRFLKRVLTPLRRPSRIPN